MPRIYIDNVPHEVEAGQNLLHAALSLGLNLPYFCWHPAMGSAGACRQCAVKQYRDENDKQGRLVMACMTPVSQEARFSIEDKEAKDFRAGIVECLMTNHPHDCPICDEGGECHLQDMTVMTGHNYRDYRFKKRTYENQDLGPLVNHEMNRCIQCYRCVRFYKDYAGGRDFDVFGSKNQLYFGRQEDGTLESEFSGNLVEVCPTGVFTDKSYKEHYTRRWDLSMAPSICVHCGVGCNITPGERYGKVRRVRNRYNHEVNGYFMCDRGRYGYEFVNSPRRVMRPHVRTKDGYSELTKDQMVEYVAKLIRDGAKPIGIGSPHASLESNFALREFVGADKFFLGTPERYCRLAKSMLDALQNGPARSPSLREIGEADAVFVLGEDLTNTAPMTALQVRQSTRRQPMKQAEKMGIPDWNDLAVREAVQDKKGPLYVAAAYATKLDDIATGTYRAAPYNLARLGFAVAHLIDPAAPTAPDLDADTQALAQQIADALRAAETPLILTGPSCGSATVIEAAANIAWALCRTGKPALLSFTAPDCNSVGMAMMGVHGVETAIDTVTRGDADTVIVLENDLYRRVDADKLDEFFAAAKHVIVLVHSQLAATSNAEAVLPAGTFAEGDGTFVNSEGRAQRFYQVFQPETDILEGWRWLYEIRAAAGLEGGDDDVALDDVIDRLVETLPQFGPVHDIAGAEFRVKGLKIPRQTHRASGRTAVRANISVSELGVRQDADTAMAYSMEGVPVTQAPPAMVASFWAPGWNSVQAVSKFQEEVGGPLRGGDPGVRLIEPRADADAPYYQVVPAAFTPQADEFLLLSLYHIFGSESLSALSPPIAALTPKPYLAMRSDTARGLGLAAGDAAELAYEDGEFHLPVVLRDDLPEGVIAAPFGLREVTLPNIPAFAKVRKAARP